MPDSSPPTDAQMPQGWPVLLLVLVLFSYLVSFILPAGEVVGWQAFLFSLLFSFGHFTGHNLNWSPGFNVVPLLAWLANPILWYGLWSLARRRWRRAALAGSLAFVCGLTMLAANPPLLKKPQPPPDTRMTVVHADGTQSKIGPVPVAHGPTPGQWASSFAGYLVWLWSMIVLALGSGLLARVAHRASLPTAHRGN